MSDMKRFFVLAALVMLGACVFVHASLPPFGWTSVKDFGAVGDGVADDTDALQAAIDNAYFEHPTALEFSPTFFNRRFGPGDGPGGKARYWGGTVYVPAGTYRTTKSLVLHYKLALVGDPNFASVIDSSATAAMVCWEGEWDEQAVDWNAYWAFDKLCRNVVLDNLRVRGSDYGLHTLGVGASGMHVSNCWFEGGQAGFAVTGFLMGGVIEDSEFNPAMWLLADEGARVNTSTFRNLEFGTDGLRTENWRVLTGGCIQSNTFEGLVFRNTGSGFLLNSFTTGITNSFDNVRSVDSGGPCELFRFVDGSYNSLTRVQGWNDRPTVTFPGTAAFMEDVIVAEINAYGHNVTALDSAPIVNAGVGSTITREMWPGDCSYEGYYLPESTGMPWVVFSDGHTPASSDGDVLTIDTLTNVNDGPEHYQYYTLNDLDCFDGRNFETVTIEWRMLLEAGSGSHQIDIGNGTNEYSFTIATDALYGTDTPVSMDTTDDFHTYRLEIPGPSSAGSLYVDGGFVGSASGVGSVMNGLRFGDTSGSSQSLAYWDHIRWDKWDAPACGDLGYLVSDIGDPSGNMSDCYVNLYDFSAMSVDWLKCTDPTDTTCQGVSGQGQGPPSYSLEGDMFPTDTTVNWVEYNDAPSGSIRCWTESTVDMFTIDTQTVPDTTAEHQVYYTLQDLSQFDGTNPNGIVIEWRMRMGVGSGFQYMDIGNGELTYNFTFLVDRVYVGGGSDGGGSYVYLDMTNGFHAFRAELIPGSDMVIHIDDVQRGLHPGYVGNGLNGIVFGDTADNRSSVCDWDYIRWGSSEECGGWGYFPGDIVGVDSDEPDCHVDVHDFARMAVEWLTCNDPTDSECWDAPTYSFEGDMNPTETAPNWVEFNDAPAGAAVSDGDVYTIDTQTVPGSGASNQVYYRFEDLGKFNGNSPGGTIIELCLKMEPGSDFHYFYVGDGTLTYDVRFKPDRVYAGSYVLMDTADDFHVYRLEMLPGSDVKLYVDDVYKTSHPGYSGSLNGMEWGDTSATRSSVCNWDYIRWSVPQ